MIDEATDLQRRWRAFIVCAVAAIATILDMVKINVAMKPIQDTLDASSTQAQLIVAGYVLTFGMALVPAGRLGDVWRRKWMFLFGATLFTLASAACTIAPSAEFLVVGRLVQGVAAGSLMPQVIGFMQQMFQGKERGRVFGIFGACIGLGTAFGPTLGGLLIGIFGEETGWRAIYGMNLPLGLAIILFAIWFLPGSQPRSESMQLDLVGVGLLSATVCLVMIPLVLTTGQPSDDPARWWLLLGAAVLGAAFYVWERRFAAAGKQPAVNFDLFRLSSYRWGVVIGSLFFAIMPPTFYVMTQFAQTGLGHEPVVVGLITIPYALISALTSAVAGRYTHAHAKLMVLGGISVFTAGLIGMTVIGGLASAELAPWLMAAVLAVAGIGPGVLMPANQMRAVSEVPVTQAGVAGSVMQVGQRAGNALGVAVASSVFYAISVSGTVQAAREGYVVAMLVLVGIATLATVIAALDWRDTRGAPRARSEGGVAD